MRTAWALLFVVTSASAAARDQEWYDLKTCGVELMTAEEAEAFRTANGLSAPKTPGVVVKSYTSPWERSDKDLVKEGDQIEAVNGEKIQTEEEFQRELEKRKSPSVCKLMVLRRVGKKYALAARPVDFSIRTNREVAKGYVEVTEEKTTGERVAEWKDFKSVGKVDAWITLSFKVDKEEKASLPILSLTYLGKKYLLVKELVVRDGEKIDRFPLLDPRRRFDDGFASESTFISVRGNGIRLFDRLTEGRSKETVIRLVGELGDCDAVPIQLSKMRDAYEAYGGTWPKAE